MFEKEKLKKKVIDTKNNIFIRVSIDLFENVWECLRIFEIPFDLDLIEKDNIQQNWLKIISRIDKLKILRISERMFRDFFLVDYSFEEKNEGKIKVKRVTVGWMKSIGLWTRELKEIYVKKIYWKIICNFFELIAVMGDWVWTDQFELFEHFTSIYIYFSIKVIFENYSIEFHQNNFLSFLMEFSFNYVFPILKSQKYLQYCESTYTWEIV